MIGKRNLGKAVVLGLLLSTGMYGAAWAADIPSSGLWDPENPIFTEIPAGDNLIVTTDGIGIGPKGTVNVINGDLTVDSGSNSIQSGYSENATVQILANNVTLTSGDNGIFTTLESGYRSTVQLGEENGRKIQSLTINAEGQGIDNKNGDVYIYGTDDSVINISTTAESGIFKGYYSAVHNETDGTIEINGSNISLTAENDSSDGINHIKGKTILNSNGVVINANGHGVYSEGGLVSLNTKGSNSISALGDMGSGVWAGFRYGTGTGDGKGIINIIASAAYDETVGTDSLDVKTGYDNTIYSRYNNGIISSDEGTINVIADRDNFITGQGSAVTIDALWSNSPKSIINIVAGGSNIFGLATDDEYGEYVLGGEVSLNGAIDSEINITSISGDTQIYNNGSSGISISSGEKNKVRVQSGANIYIENEGMGIFNQSEGSTVELIANQGNNTIVTNETGLESARQNAKIKLDAQNNTVQLFSDQEDSGDAGIMARIHGSVLLEADVENEIQANSTEELIDGAYGDKYAIHANTNGTVDVKAGAENTIYGAVYATGDEKNGVGSVTIGKLDVAGSTFSRTASGDVVNYIGSAAVIDKAGDLDQSKDETMRNLDVVSALYAQGGAEIHLSGNNTICTFANKEDDTTAERSIWAYDKGKINVDGYTVIRTNQYDESPNSMDVAVAAGTATNLDTGDFTNYPVDDDSMAKVTINYANANGVKSYIEGDVLAAYGGVVTIQAQEGVTRAVHTAGIDIHGNLLSGNKGVLNVELGNGGTLTGRADDYGDAGTEGLDSQHTSFFNPAFSSEILTGGEVNLTMGEGSYWKVTGQSWVTSVDTGHSEHVEIDLSATDSELNKTAQALTIGEMKGNAMFTMQLDGKRSVSDMLYMKKAEGEYFINLKKPVTVEEMYDRFDGLRFATVGKDSHATFSAGTYGNGVYNVEYEVGTDDYDGNEENSAYNSTSGKGEMDEAKPGNDLVDNLFKDEPQEAAANGIMTLAAIASPEATDATDSSDTTEDMGKNTDMNGKVLNDETNFKLIGVKSTELSNAGKTIIDMSKVNYSNAIYMDRLNKRMGEARYIDGDEGLWVRIRHDRIGRSDAFRSKNTMMELGYDKRVDDREDGEHRRGFAIDYMRGTTDYHNVAGDGDVRRGGVWFYDTWLGNKGHYSDYVLKFGRLSNDFDIYSELGEKITGDYSNFVYSASAEYGRKKDIGKDWYFEPQVQLQYAHVTDADYTTSQGTSVELDAIDSLIGRVGFRLGKDMGENNTFYIKADVLHEFLGDQDISAFDDTGRLDTTYENEGTWYDVGLGFSHQFSKGTYMFLDVEKTFGNDNEDTYQFNVGMNWKV